MGDFPRAMLIACLTVLRYLLFATGALLAILVIVQQVRGDEAAAPLPLGLGALAMLAAGWASGKAAGYLTRQG